MRLAEQRWFGPRRLVIRGSSLSLGVAVATWLTLLGFYGPTQIALAAPLAGVVIVAALTSARRAIAVDVAAISVVAFVVIGTLLESWRLGAVGVVTSLAQYLIVVAVGVRSGFWPLVAARHVVTLNDVPRVALAIVLAGVGSSLLRWPGLGLVAPSDLENVLLTAVRTSTWGLAFGAVALLWAAGDRPRSWAESLRRGVSAYEMTAALGLTILSAFIAFTRPGGLPAIFPLFVAVAWASLRLCPLVATSLAVVVGAGGVVGTIAGLGSFAQVSDTRIGAVAAQSFMLTLVAVTVALALANRDRENALITAKDLARDAAERAFERDLVLGNLAEGVVLFGGDGRIVLRNAAGRRMFGREALPEPDRPPEVSDLGLRDLDGNPLPADFIPTLLAESGEVPRELSLRLESDVSSSRVLHLRMQRVTSQDDRTLVVVTFRDITAEFQRTAELEAFAGVLAHDLARPLAVIRGWTEILVEDAREATSLPAEQIERDGGRVLVAAETMRRLLEDLLALTLADNRQLQREEVDLSQVCWGVVGAHGWVEQAVSVRVEPGLVVLGDLTLVRQLFDNLLTNAVKYVPEGRAASVTVSGGTHTTEWLRVRVQDNGVGIPAEAQPHVFDDFYRAEAHQQAFPGTGIGLAICRRVVDRHDGRIRVASSSPEQGTVVEVSLPRPLEQQLSAPGSSLSASASSRGR